MNAAIGLIDEGSTIPFIARYRKEVTGNLDDSQLRDLSEQLVYLRNLDERMHTVLASIKEQGKLSDELQEAILNVVTLAELEDLYRPYKPKRKTRATIAKEKGLEPLSVYIKKGKKEEDFQTFLNGFINKDKGVNTHEDALNGALDIIAEEISDEPSYRRYIKGYITKQGFITTKEVAKDEKRYIRQIC